MSEHTTRTLPPSPSITHLKLEAKALRRAFDAGEAASRGRVAAVMSPVDGETLSQSDALFVIAREYGFSSWPSLKRHIQQRTCTVFSDSTDPTVAAALTVLLDKMSVTVANALIEALDTESEVLVLHLESYDGEPPLSRTRAAALKARKVVAMGQAARALCLELDLDVYNGAAFADGAFHLVESALLGTPAPASAPQKLLAQSPQLDAAGFAVGGHHVHGVYVPAEYRSSLDTVAELDGNSDFAVIVRQANFVKAAVGAHPAAWSQDYCRLFTRVVYALADRDTERFVPIVVARPIQPPGTIAFNLEPLQAESDSSHRHFHFRFERPTAFTATLEHRGSEAMMVCFQGEGRQLHFSRKDAEQGETMTIAVQIAESAIRELGHRYWVLIVQNFDTERAAAATLTVQYDSGEQTILPLPGAASFEYCNQHAQALLAAVRQGETTALRRIARHAPDVADVGQDVVRLVTAREHGFARWDLLQGHVAWSPEWLPQDGASGRDIYYAQARAKHGDVFSIDQLLESMSPSISEDLRAALKTAGDLAKARRHAVCDIDHLVTAMLGCADTRRVLRRVGCDIERLRDGLTTSIAALSRSARNAAAPEATRALFGVVWRANFVGTLGRDGTGCAAALVAVFAESSEGRELLRRQGIDEDDVRNVVTHGIPKTLPAGESDEDLLSRDVEAALQQAFAHAQSNALARGSQGDAATPRGDHAVMALEHLLLALLQRPAVAAAISARGADVASLRDEVAAFIAATMPTGDGPAQPTRALNRAMQMAVARAARDGVQRAHAGHVLMAVNNEAQSPAADFLRAHGLTQDVLARAAFED